ncbi:MAG: Stp1/IreP family PP2C-type Ser/Thr phosphatase [Thermoleophilaceae bacterium]|nr:Stp1/IreP family PP2C-type Ser/Thr phosphatase [Thermoleophilaceae bacterium]
MTLRIAEFAAASDTGRLRRGNEDAYYARAPFFAVADGMGGAQAGEVASGIAIAAISKEPDDSLGPEARLKRIVLAANKEIHERASSDEELRGMGTTMTVLQLGNGEVTVAHVGDSRAYRVRSGRLEQLTQDHSLVGEMVRRGALTEAEAEVHPQRSILTRALGPEGVVDVDVHTHPIRDGDIFMLCSDGLTGMVDDATIEHVLASGLSMQAAADDLIRRANQNGGVDNITVVSLLITGRDLSSASQDTGAQTVVGQAIAAPTANGVFTATTPPAGAAVRAQARARNKKSRRVVTAVLISMVLLITVAGGIIGTLQVYFLGVDEHGLVTVYRGLPYEIPLLNFYTQDYVSTRPVTELTPEQQARLLDHRLRTRRDVIDLIAQIEQNRVTSTTGSQ